jgi:hypothetical protein
MAIKRTINFTFCTYGVINIDLDVYVYRLLALKLGYKSPSQKEAELGVKNWFWTLAAKSPKHNSEWLQQQAVLEIADKKLYNDYQNWHLYFEVTEPD